MKSLSNGTFSLIHNIPYLPYFDTTGFTSVEKTSTENMCNHLDW